LGSKQLGNSCIGVRWLFIKGIEGTAELEQLVSLLAQARVLQPKIWKGKPVTYTDDTGEEKTVTEFRSPR